MMRVVRAWLVLGALCGCTNDYDLGLAPAGASATTGSTGAGPAAGSGGAGSGASGGAAVSGAGGGSVGGGAGAGGTGSGGAPADAVPVYFSSRTALWLFDTVTHERVFIHELVGCDGIEDIAVDAQGNVWANDVSANLYQVDGNGNCQEIADKEDVYFTTTLGYAPAGILRGSAPGLVGYDGATYVQIDLAGTKAAIGDLGGEYPHGLDVTLIDETRGWAAVGEGGDCDLHCAVRIDPVTGAAQGGALTFGVEGIYGIAWSAGIVYGFHHDGFVVAIDPDAPAPQVIPWTNGDPPREGVWGAASPPPPAR